MRTTMWSILLFLGACQVDRPSKRPPEAQPVGGFADKVQALVQRMHTRYTGARRLEEAIARSDLERTRLEAHALGVLDEPDVLPIWRPYFEAVAESARQIEAAGDVRAAAGQFAILSLRCAHCHDAAAAKIVLAQPAGAGTGKIGMAEHQQAALTMWEGLMAPSEAHWLAGAQALTTVPLTMVARAATPGFEDDVDDVARIRLYARRGLDAQGRDARADVFGSLLGTCAHCHAVLRDR
jgi:cytochrome c553